MTLMAVDLVSVPVSDQARSLRWFVDMLGFVVDADSVMPNGTRWVQLAAPGHATTLALVTWYPTMEPGSLRGLVLKVADIAATHRRYEDQGMAPAALTVDFWGTFTTISDPDGNELIVCQPPAWPAARMAGAGATL